MNLTDIFFLLLFFTLAVSPLGGQESAVDNNIRFDGCTFIAVDSVPLDAVPGFTDNTASGNSLGDYIEITFGSPAMPVEIRTRLLFNPNLESSHFFVPGLVGIILQLVTLFLTSFANSW